MVYGMPGVEVWEASERGEVLIGGCCIFIDNPTHGCEAGHRWVQPA